LRKLRGMRLRRQTDTGMGKGHGKEVEGKMLHAAEFGKKKEVKLEEAFLVQSPTPVRQDALEAPDKRLK
jgi:hypothetical protein